MFVNTSPKFSTLTFVLNRSNIIPYTFGNNTPSIGKKIKIIINLAAQAGVRNSIDNPKAYLDNNIFGFFNILEISKEQKIYKTETKITLNKLNK